MPKKKVIEVKNLTCLEGESLLVNNVSFEINNNDKVAIIGKSGEGKSVIFDILLKNITNYNGSIKFMGVNIEKLNRENMLNNIGYYSQKINIFNDDIYSNIRYGDFKNMHMAERLISEFGLDFLKNRNLGEDGINISKGEKTRIETIRLLLNSNNLFLLDEPFEGLDCIMKKKIIKETKEYLKNKTVIIISHDFNILNELVSKYIFIDNEKKYI